MKNKILLGAFILGCAFTASADGYTDGIEYYKAGQYSNARTVLNRTLNDAGTDKALAYYYLGNIDLVNKKAADAKANFEKGIAANPECPYNYVGMGAIDLQNGNSKAADEQFKLAQKLGKKNYEILVDIARAYYNADPVKFEKEVAKYLEKAHKESKHKEPSIYILEGDMLFDAKDLGGAAGKYEQAITFDQDNPEGYVKFATSYIGVNPEYTLEKLNELVAKQPNSALAQRELAERYYEVNQWSNAAEQYGKYMANPNHFPEDKARYLVLIYASGDYQKAVQIADEILAQNPNDPQALRVKMLAQYELKEFNAAKQTAEKFLNIPVPAGEKAPFNQKDYSTYGMILEELNDVPAAIIAYQKAVDFDPTKTDNIKRLSAAYTKAEDHQAAAETFQLAIDTDPEGASLTDYYTASARWMNASNKAEDPNVASADAALGVKAVDKVIAEASEVTPAYLQRKAILLLLQNNKDVNEEVAQAYMALLAALEADPANMDATNPNNRLSWAKQCYQILTKYYSDLGDVDKSNEMYEKYKSVE